jgi:hypothetical protein
MVLGARQVKRIAQSALDQVRAYSAERGCTVFDEPGRRFLAPDRSRAIVIKKVEPRIIYIWDTVAGKISLPRERGSSRRRSSVDMNGDRRSRGGQVAPLEAKESEL